MEPNKTIGGTILSVEKEILEGRKGNIYLVKIRLEDDNGMHEERILCLTPTHQERYLKELTQGKDVKLYAYQPKHEAYAQFEILESKKVPG